MDVEIGKGQKVTTSNKILKRTKVGGGEEEDWIDEERR